MKERTVELPAAGEETRLNVIGDKVQVRSLPHADSRTKDGNPILRDGQGEQKITVLEDGTYPFPIDFNRLVFKGPQSPSYTPGNVAELFVYEDEEQTAVEPQGGVDAELVGGDIATLGGEDVTGGGAVRTIPDLRGGNTYYFEDVLDGIAPIAFSEGEVLYESYIWTLGSTGTPAWCRVVIPNTDSGNAEIVLFANQQGTEPPTNHQRHWVEVPQNNFPQASGANVDSVSMVLHTVQL